MVDIITLLVFWGPFGRRGYEGGRHVRLFGFIAFCIVSLDVYFVACVYLCIPFLIFSARIPSYQARFFCGGVWSYIVVLVQFDENFGMVRGIYYKIRSSYCSEPPCPYTEDVSQR